MDRINIKLIFLIVSGVIITLSLIFAVLFCWPRYLELKSLQGDISKNQDELNQKREYFKELSRSKEELKNYETEFSKIDNALPRDNSVPSFLNFFQLTASQSGLILTSFSPFSAAPSLLSSSIDETQMSFSLEGTYTAFKNFLSVLEKSSRFIDVENISFSSPKEKEIFSFDIKIKFYSELPHSGGEAVKLSSPANPTKWDESR